VRLSAYEECGANIRKVRSPVAGLRFHDLRHQVIAELSESGASDETVMSIAGHIDRRMMSHYSHIRQQARRAAIEQLGKEIFHEGHNRGTVAPEAVHSANVPFSQVLERNGGDDGTRNVPPL
jgi:integrase-like protein